MFSLHFLARGKPAQEKQWLTEKVRQMFRFYCSSRVKHWAESSRSTAIWRQSSPGHGGSAMSQQKQGRKAWRGRPAWHHRSKDDGTKTLHPGQGNGRNSVSRVRIHPSWPSPQRKRLGRFRFDFRLRVLVVLGRWPERGRPNPRSRTEIRRVRIQLRVRLGRATLSMGTSDSDPGGTRPPSPARTRQGSCSGKETRDCATQCSPEAARSAVSLVPRTGRE